MIPIVLLLGVGAPAPPAPPEPPAAVAPALLDDYEELVSAYEAALRSYEQQFLFGDATHPAKEYLARFTELSDAGDRQATLWCLDHLRQAGLRTSDRRSRAGELVELLFDGRTGAELLPSALRMIEVHYRSLELDAVRDWCETLFTHEQSEVRAGALVALAAMVSEGGRTRRDAKLEEARALWTRALTEEGGTAAAQRAGVALVEPLEKEYRRALRDFERGRSEEDPTPAFALQMRELAELGAGPAELWLMMQVVVPAGDAQAVRQTGLSLIERHADSEVLVGLAEALPGLAADIDVVTAGALAESLLEGAANERVRAAGLLAYAEVLASYGDDAQAQQAIALLAERAELVSADPMRDVDPEQQVFQWRHLQVGRVAPDFLTQDVDGTEFRLSDYRGKVVLLDFWGFW